MNTNRFFSVSFGLVLSVVVLLKPSIAQAGCSYSDRLDCSPVQNAIIDDFASLIQFVLDQDDATQDSILAALGTAQKRLDRVIRQANRTRGSFSSSLDQITIKAIYRIHRSLAHDLWISLGPETATEILSHAVMGPTLLAVTVRNAQIWQQQVNNLGLGPFLELDGEEPQAATTGGLVGSLVGSLVGAALGGPIGAVAGAAAGGAIGAAVEEAGGGGGGGGAEPSE